MVCHHSSKFLKRAFRALALSRLKQEGCERLHIDKEHIFNIKTAIEMSTKLLAFTMVFN